MLWALVSSAYVLYLYRKLNAHDVVPPGTSHGASAVEAELSALDEKIGQLETRLRGGKPPQ